MVFFRKDTYSKAAVDSFTKMVYAACLPGTDVT